MHRFWEIYNEIDEPAKRNAIDLFQLGLRKPSPLFSELTLNPLRLLLRLLHTISKYAQLDDVYHPPNSKNNEREDKKKDNRPQKVQPWGD